MCVCGFLTLCVANDDYANWLAFILMVLLLTPVIRSLADPAVSCKRTGSAGGPVEPNERIRGDVYACVNLHHTLFPADTHFPFGPIIEGSCMNQRLVVFFRRHWHWRISHE